MAFTTTEVNGWFQTIDGLPPTTASIPSALATQYVGELNGGTATPGVIQAELENFVAPPIPPPFTSTDLFYRTSVAQFVLREFQAAWDTVPSTGAGSQFDNWVARIIANPSLETGGGMSQALAGTPQFMAEYGTTSATQPATLAFITQLAANLQVAVGPGAMANVGLPVWQVLQNFVTSPTVITSLEAPIANFQNLLLAGAVPGGSIFDLPPPTQALTLTTGIDSPTQGFTTGNGATATTAGSVFNALPVAGILGLNNTLNTGDNLQATDAAAGATTLNVTDVFATAGIVANPPFASAVTLNGVNTLNISNQATLLGLGIPGGFQGSVTGLTTANDQNSFAEVRLGGATQGLGSAAAAYDALTNVNISGYAGTTAAPVFEAFINAGAAGVATGANTINIGITGRLGGTALQGTATGAAVLQFANDSGVAGTGAAPDTTFGTWAITTAAAANLELVQSAIIGDVDVGGATTLNLSGAGNIAVGQDAVGNWQTLTTINASAETGTVIITGASTGADNAFASAANPDWLFGSTAGLLDDTGGGNAFRLTSYMLGTGTNILDVSSATAAQVDALTTTPGATVAANNEVIVSDAAATTGSNTTFATIAGFSILGVTDAAGTINMANVNVTAAFNEILYETSALGDVTITNQTAALTVDTKDNGLGFALTSTGTGLADTFTLDLGNALHNTAAAGSGAGAVGDLTLIADSIVNINATGQTAGGAPIVDTLGFVSLTPALAGNEQVTIGGTTDLTIGFGSTDGAIGDFTTGPGLNVNNMILTITNTGVTTLEGSFTGILGTFVPPGNDPGNTQEASTNAVVINASTSGGLIMNGADLNFTTSATVAGSVGDVITGSTSAGNVLIGSMGNDVLNGNATTGVGDTIVTNGGTDIINLAAGNTADDHIGFYEAAAGTYAPGGVVTAFNPPNITNAADLAQLGFWGLPTGGVQTEFGSVGAATGGTSLNASTVNNFNAGTDILDFGVVAWGVGTNGAGGPNRGLVDGNMITHPVAGTDAVAQLITPGLLPTATNTLMAGTDLIELSGTFVGGASQVAATLESLNTNVFFAAGLTAHGNAHMLVAYTTGTGTTIADLEFHAGALTQGSSAQPGTTVHVSDMVDLVGVSFATFIANTHNFHFV